MRSVLMLLALLTSLAAGAAGAPQPPNLVRNPGFEVRSADGFAEAWNGDGTVYGRVGSPVHAGEAALRFVNPSADKYVLCRQALPLKVGRSYELGVWAKSENLRGDDNGATICLEWYTAQDQYLGGAYPPGVKETTDWRHITAVSGRVPAAAARCYVVVYVRKGMTGTAWWDDVEVKQWTEPPLRTMLLRPNYRGQITPEIARVEAVAELSLQDWGLELADVRLRARMAAAGGHVVRERIVVPRGDRARLSLPATGLAPGRYQLRLELVRAADNAVLDTNLWRLVVPTAAELAGRPAYVDRHNRLVVNGKPFLPLGMYWSSINEKELGLYADSAFNCLMPYGMPSREQMDAAERRGLKVIYSVKDVYAGSSYCPKEVRRQEDERAFIAAKTAAFRRHPALLAWYLNDELSLEYMPRLEAHQEWLEQLDPGHPTWIVLYQVGQLDLYRRTYDVLGTDPYPIPMQPARHAASYTVSAERSMYRSRPLWQVPQAMNWAGYRKTEEEKKGLRMPTLPELRSMTWQCLTEGANGLIYYSWFDLRRFPASFAAEWANVKQVAAEVKQWSPVLLSVERPPRIRVASRPWLHWTTRRVGDAAYLFAVNDEDETHETSFDLRQPPRTVTVEGQEKPVTPAGQVLPARFGPFELRIYKLEW